ncbi:lysylphosphatidylglycerol synthase transmembrane domain-containing protein [Caulobacter sp. 1776]|uniref:lysylphosphatidylglycerol synthase transmembrane domain-containing protein n=1 Tax=Caulobacter sp. 1776 TaxID=3156420 RepID=UPI0033964FA2
MTETPAHPAPGGVWRRWLLGAATAAALVWAVFHFGELTAFAQLLRRAQPAWLALALALQILTYVSVSAGWGLVLARARSPRSLWVLTPIAVTKLFADQAMPTAGLGGNIVLIDQLRRLGVARGTAVAALLVSLIGYYLAYAALALVMLLLLWMHDHATPLMVGLVTTFLLVALSVPALALWLRGRGGKPLPTVVERIGPVRLLLQTLGQAPADLVADRRLIAGVAACNGLVFLIDAATLLACRLALGGDASFATSFIALMMASIVATLGPVPLGLGTFEATCTATQHLLGVPLEQSFTATIVLRLLTLWAPMLPGLALLHLSPRGRPNRSRLAGRPSGHRRRS